MLLDAVVQVGQPLDVDQPLGRGEIGFHERQQIGAPGQDGRMLPIFGLSAVEERDCVDERLGARVVERFHAAPSPAFAPCLASAASTRCRVSGPSRKRIPMASKTALATAGAVGTSGGSPIPLAPVEFAALSGTST